jgi:putative tricarboxylic transport membrane protein
MRNALSIGEGHWTIFLQRPMSLFLLIVVVAVLVLPRVVRWLKPQHEPDAVVRV